MPARARACPLQSAAGKIKTKMHFKALSRDSEKNDVGTSQMPLSVKPRKSFAMKLGLPELSERP